MGWGAPSAGAGEEGDPAQGVLGAFLPTIRVTWMSTGCMLAPRLNYCCVPSQLSGQVGAVTRLGDFQSHSGSGGLRSKSGQLAPEPTGGDIVSRRPGRAAGVTRWRGQAGLVASGAMRTAKGGQGQIATGVLKRGPTPCPGGGSLPPSRQCPWGTCQAVFCMERPFKSTQARLIHPVSPSIYL